MWSQISAKWLQLPCQSPEPTPLFNGTASNESVKHDLTNWFGFASDESVHETVPLYMEPNVVTERNEMKKCNKQRCNNVPDKPLINRQWTENWMWTVWFKGTDDPILAAVLKKQTFYKYATELWASVQHKHTAAVWITSYWYSYTCICNHSNRCANSHRAPSRKNTHVMVLKTTTDK